ncbi:MAG: response regulator receiver protein [Desulfobacteraceae bacterium 4572_19]|nr:MAG: response regulator receiver protein [Desulfobacteraceae bacterium 4572_19]
MEPVKTKVRVLVVDDDMAQRMILRITLEEEGYEVLEAKNGFEAFNILSGNLDIRLVITDLEMPEMNGFELIKIIRAKELRYTYIIMLTSMDDKESLINALSLGADDYLTKPVFPDELKLRLGGGTRLLKLESQEELILSMAKLSEYRSEETGFHLERTAHYVKLLAEDLSKNNPELKLTLAATDEISKVSQLHDLGKVAILDSILHKPGRLTDAEFDSIKEHTVIGGKLIKEIYKKTGSPYLWFAYEIAMFHHEKWNGKGYPQGLAGEDIPLPARIMSLADVYDAMTTVRCYKDAYSHEKVKNIIIEEKGQHFDPKIVDAFLRQEDAWLIVKEKFQDDV